MTTSANIAGVPGHFAVAGHGTRPWPFGNAKVYKIDEIRPGKKKKKEKLYYGQVGMLFVNTKKSVQEAYTQRVGKPEDGLWKIPSLGKIGVWRTIKGNRYFFPVDGSSPIPKLRGGAKVKGKGAPGKNLYADPKKKKKGLLSKILGLIGGGGGAKASAKDVKPKTKGKGKSDSPKKGKSNIPGGKDMLGQADDMLLKAQRSKGGKSLVGSLKKMQAALQDDDPKAFKKAEASLAKATSKLAKKRG